MTGRQVRIALAVLTVLVALYSPAASFADSISFSGSLPSGTAAYDTTTGLFSVTGASIDTLTVTDGTTSQYAISGGTLNLTSGPTTSSAGCTGGPCTAFFGPGGLLAITGGVGSLSLPAGDTLLSAGSYLSGAILSFTGTGSGVFAANLDPSQITLDPAISALLGNGTITSASNTELNISLTFNSGVYSGQVASSGVGVVDPVTAPEPAELPLLLSGLGAVGLLALRKRSTRCAA